MLTRALDAIVDAAVVAFALFTVAFHAALVLGAPVAATSAAWLAVTVVAIVVVVRLRPASEPHARDVDVEARPDVATASLAVGAIAAVVVGTTLLDDARWWLFDGAAIVALLLAGAAVLRARRIAREPHQRSASTFGAVVALVLAAAFALGAVVTVRPDADDVLLVNRSVWIEHRGSTFPERDTLLSDQVFSYTRPENPSPAIEPFVGVLARYSPWPAPTIAYLGFAPAVSFLAVLALWQLLRALRAPTPWLALVVAAVFLALDGKYHTSFGNFAFGRAWQGKVVFVFLAVPLLWRHALAWSRDRDRRSLVMLVATGIAAVGFSTTALFVAPPIIVLAAIAGFARDRAGPIVFGAAAALVYPVGAGLFALAANRQPVTVALAAGRAALGPVASPVGIGRGLHSWDPWYVVFGTGVTATVAAVAALCGWYGTRERAARLVLVLAPLALLAVGVLPPVLHALRDASTSSGESVLWRIVWVVPVPAMVGVLATGALLRFGARAVAIAAVAVVAVCAVGGTPVWSRDNGARVEWRPQWDLDRADASAARRLLSLARDGDVVASPEPISGAVAVQSVEVRTVDPRGSYTVGRQTRNPGFHAENRRLIARAMTNGISPSELGAFVASLDLLSVDVVCTGPGARSTVVTNGLQQAAFVPVGRDAQCEYWRRAG